MKCKKLVHYNQTYSSKPHLLFPKGSDNLTSALTVKEDSSRYSRTTSRKIENPHDKFFKETLGNVEVAKNSEGSELVMTLADILRAEGKEEGKKEGIKTVALEMLRKNFTVELVAEITHMDVKEVQRLKEDIQ